MNIVKLRDIKLIHRNPLHSYTLMMKNRKGNWGNNPIHHCNEKNKILRNKFPLKKRPIYGKLQNTDERNQRWHKQMEKYTMFVDWNNQYSENVYTTQSNLKIQCNSYQATNGIFHRTRTNNFTICMETQETSNSQSNLEKEEWNWKNQPSWLQTIL